MDDDVLEVQGNEEDANHRAMYPNDPPHRGKQPNRCQTMLTLETE